MTPARPRPGLREVEPYAAPQLDVPVRLNTNECPYPLPEGFSADLRTAVGEIALNRYPDREATRLREELAAHTAHPFEGTWAANGSNEVIQQLLLAYGGAGTTAAVFAPTYELYSRLSWVTHTDVAAIELTPPWEIGPEHVGAAAAIAPEVIFVCSPNNPTGNAQDPAVVAHLAEAVPGALVIVDEAYIEFGGRSSLGLVAAHPNVAVVRTMSKAFALAGARLGYLLADPVVVDDLRRVRLPYHVSAITQAAGLAALRHGEEALAILGAVREQRDRILEGLSQIPGVTAYPSDSNFVLFRTDEAEAVWQGLLERGVLIRDFTKTVPGCLRVNAGTPEETDAFLSAMKEVLA